MEEPKKRKFTCPQCAYEQEFSVWESVNVSLEPKLKEQVLCRELNSFTCGGCARVSWFSHPIQYHDAGQKLMIWLPCGEAEKPPLDEGSMVMNLMANGGYKFRLVNSYNDLIEKIRIFDDGQDDRAVEALKRTYVVPQAEIFYRGILEKDGVRKAVRLTVVKKAGKTVQEVPIEELRQQEAVVSRAAIAADEKGKWLCVDANYAAELLKRA